MRAGNLEMRKSEPLTRDCHASSAGYARAIRFWGEVRKGGEPPSELNSHDLDVDAPRARAVQLGEQDGLEAAEGELAAADAHGHAAAEEGGAEMRVRVAALAIGVARIVVPVPIVLRHQRLDHGLEVLDEGA